jgi:hypothetical protein
MDRRGIDSLDCNPALAGKLAQRTCSIMPTVVSFIVRYRTAACHDIAS